MTGQPLLIAGWAADLGAAYGGRFAPSGWGLTASGLPAGGYNVVFFPWSTVTDTIRYEAAVTRVVYVY